MKVQFREIGGYWKRVCGGRGGGGGGGIERILRDLKKSLAMLH